VQKILPPQGFNLRTIHLAASHHIDYAAPTHIKAGSQAKKKDPSVSHIIVHYPLIIFKKQEPTILDFAMHFCLFVCIFQDKNNDDWTVHSKF